MFASSLGFILLITAFLFVCQASFALKAHVCPRTCVLHCPFGQAKDVMGCPLCRCKLGGILHSKQILPGRCSSSLVACPRRFCPFGHALDSMGCPSCSCLTNVCGPEPQCTARCPGGFLRSELGCQTCRCKPASNAKPPCFPAVCRHFCSAATNLVTSPQDCRCDCINAPLGRFLTV